MLPMREINRSILNILLYVPFLFINVIRLSRILSFEKVDYLQINDFYNLLGVVIRFIGFRVKLITFVRLIPSSMPTVLSCIWANLAQRYSYKVIAVSDAVHRELRPMTNTIKIYSAIKPVELGTELRKNNSEDICRFLYLANYTRGKGHEAAIRAFSAAYKTRSDIRLNFFGGDMGLKKNEKFRNELVEIIAREGLLDVVEVNDFSNDIELTYSTHDVFLNFSMSESFSNTCCEAGFYGLPVIASRCGGPEEIIEHEVTGFLVDQNDWLEITDKMLFLASSKSSRIAMGRAASKRVRLFFGISTFVNKMQNCVFNQ